MTDLGTSSANQPEAAPPKIIPYAERAQWEPRESTSYRLYDLVLRSDQAKRVYNLVFSRMQKALYLCLESLPHENSAVTLAEVAVQEKITTIEKAIDQWDRAVMAVAATTPTAGLTIPVRAYTREAMQFVGLIQRYDNILVRCNAHLLASSMTRKQVSTVSQDLRSLLSRSVREIEILHLRTLESVRRSRRYVGA
jgi:hypothetical protein